MIRGAIFDLDGTLLDSMGIWNTLGEDYLRSLGIEPRENLAETFKTFSLQQSARYYQEVYGVPLSEQEIIDGVNGRIERFYLEEVHAKPGAASFLEHLRRNGVRMCMATATDRDLVEGALKHCGLAEFFPKIFTCTDVGHSKNTPEIFRAAKEFLGTAKEETFVFEDALHAAQTAKKDGFPLAGVFDPSEEHPAELRKLADLYLTDFSDFPDFWEKASR